jgi:signal recognition particle receptor subunit alpha
MLDSLTIVSPGGLILYQWKAQPPVLNPSPSRDVLNGILEQYVCSELRANDRSYHIAEGITYVWRNTKSFAIVVVYPDILFEGPRVYLKHWAEALAQQVEIEYQRLYDAHAVASNSSTIATPRPDPAVFEPIFRVLLETSKTQKPSTNTNTTTTTTQKSHPTTSSKTQRHWGGEAKVTEQAMKQLDKSSLGKEATTTAAAKAEAHERALREARAMYLPNENEEEDDSSIKTSHTTNTTNNNTTTTSWWTNTWQSVLLSSSSNRRALTDTDLDGPLLEMEALLESNNVARSTAHEICQSVRRTLRQQKLATFARVQTAVQQALETSVTQVLLARKFDLLRDIAAHSRRKRPYVILVMGINGIGKTTTLAKLAYYVKHTGQCRPLLVAGDTFRSGAIEQLSIHADCLEIPLFQMGYAKDPSAVVAAALQHATQNGHDVVLVDTAGRMQNNAGLMKALGKLVQDNMPIDCAFLVCEALVGHDGISQFREFQNAIRSSKRMDGIILSKFDTVDTKMGAAVTLAHQTQTPIVFVGVGQKYHHLQTLDVPRTVIPGLFAKNNQ